MILTCQACQLAPYSFSYPNGISNSLSKLFFESAIFPAQKKPLEMPTIESKNEIKLVCNRFTNGGISFLTKRAMPKLLMCSNRNFCIKKFLVWIDAFRVTICWTGFVLFSSAVDWLFAWIGVNGTLANNTIFLTFLIAIIFIYFLFQNDFPNSKYL